jgi:hypothetical protein
VIKTGEDSRSAIDATTTSNIRLIISVSLLFIRAFALWCSGKEQMQTALMQTI